MLSYVKGNIFLSPTRTLVNTVNTVGVMGKGIALTFKRIYPEMFRQYQRLCKEGKFNIGDLWLYEFGRKAILNFPTKKHWRNPSKPEYIRKGLEEFRERFADLGIDAISFPPLGCGNGGLDFDTVVRPLMEEYLGDLPIDVLVYPDFDDPYEPEHMDNKEMKEWLRSEPRALPFIEVWEDLCKEVEKADGHFNTEQHKKPFKVEIMEEPIGFRVRTEGTHFPIHYRDLRELWDQVRLYGFSVRKIAPAAFEKSFSYILPIFLRLPYVKGVKYSEGYRSYVHGQSTGLQFCQRDTTENHHQLSLSDFIKVEQ